MLTTGLLWQRVLLVFSVSLAAFCLGIWAALTGARRRGTDASFRDILSLSVECIRFIAIRTAANITMALTISMLGLCGLSFFAGYSFRGDRDNRIRYTYTDVLIVGRHNDHSFTVQPARMRPWDTDDMCDPEDWEPRQKLISMTYSVRRDASGKVCKDVERGGEWYRYMKDGKPIIYQEEIADAR